MSDEPKKSPPRPAPPRPGPARAPLAPRPPAAARNAAVAPVAAVVEEEEIEIVNAASVSPPPLAPTSSGAVPVAPYVAPPLAAPVPLPARPPIAVPAPLPVAVPIPPPIAAPAPLPVAVPIPPPLAVVAAPAPPPAAVPVPAPVAEALPPLPSAPPLSDRSAARAAEENSRASRRFPFEISLAIVSEHNFYAGLSLNISEGGIFVATHQEYPIGTKLEIRIVFPGEEEPTAIMTEVRWVRPHNENADGSTGMGLRFVDLSPEFLAKVHRFVKNRDPLYYEDD